MAISVSVSLTSVRGSRLVSIVASLVPVLEDEKGIYKEGALVSKKCWNSDGQSIDCSLLEINEIDSKIMFKEITWVFFRFNSKTIDKEAKNKNKRSSK